jgi:hypothetical protein
LHNLLFTIVFKIETAAVEQWQDKEEFNVVVVKDEVVQDLEEEDEDEDGVK